MEAFEDWVIMDSQTAAKTAARPFVDESRFLVKPVREHGVDTDRAGSRRLNNNRQRRFETRCGNHHRECVRFVLLQLFGQISNGGFAQLEHADPFTFEHAHHCGKTASSFDPGCKS